MDRGNADMLENVEAVSFWGAQSPGTDFYLETC